MLPTWAWVLVGIGALVAFGWLISGALFITLLIRGIRRDMRHGSRAIRDNTYLEPWNRQDW